MQLPGQRTCAPHTCITTLLTTRAHSADEPRTQWRPLFFNVLADWVRNCTSISEAALLINQRLWGLFHVHFQPNCTPDIMSPAQVRRDHLAAAVLGVWVSECSSTCKVGLLTLWRLWILLQMRSQRHCLAQ